LNAFVVSAAYVLYRVLLYDAPAVAAGAFALFPDGKGVINSASRSVKAVLRASKFEILYFQIPALNQYLLTLIQAGQNKLTVTPPFHSSTPLS
jgi:hypothetical protein